MKAIAKLKRKLAICKQKVKKLKEQLENKPKPPKPKPNYTQCHAQNFPIFGSAGGSLYNYWKRERPNSQTLRKPTNIDITFERVTSGIKYDSIAYLRVTYDEFDKKTGKYLRVVEAAVQGERFIGSHANNYPHLSKNNRKSHLVKFRKNEFIKKINQYCSKNNFIPALKIVTN